MNNTFNTYKLGEITNIIAGGDLPNSFSTEKTDLLTIPVYSNGEKNNGLYGYTDIAKVVEPAVTISARGSKVGFAAVRKQPFVPIVRLLSLIPSQDRLDVNFLFYNLKLNRQIGIGSGQPQITIPDISNRTISVPPLHKQQKIASVLTALDAKIEHNKRINAELEAMAKTIYDYWFVQFIFPNAEGKPHNSLGGMMVWNEELKREVPEGWKVGGLHDIANITMGQSPAGESYNEDGNGMVFYQGCTDFGTRFPSIRKYTTEPTRFAKKGDILLSVRAPVGTLNIAKENCCIGRGLAALNSKDNCIAYLFGVMVNLKQVFDRRNTDGTTFGSITKDDLFTLKVIKPAKEVLEMYHKLINPCFEKQNHIAEENQRLSSLRDWLLPMLMNGQVSVVMSDYSMAKEYVGLLAADEQVDYRKI